MANLRIRGISTGDFYNPPFNIYFNGELQEFDMINMDSFTYTHDFSTPTTVKLEIKEGEPYEFDPHINYVIDHMDYSTGNYLSFYFNLSDDGLTLESEEAISGLSSFVNFQVGLIEKEVKIVEVRVEGILSNDFEDIPFNMYVNDVFKEYDSIDVRDNYIYDVDFSSPVNMRLEIKDDVPIKFDPEATHEINILDYNSGNYFTYNFSTYEDGSLIESDDSIDVGDNISIIDLEVHIVEKKVTTVEKYPFLNIYNISESELDELSKLDLYKDLGDDYPIGYRGEFIVDLIRIPYEIEETDKESIRLGDVSLDVKASVLTSNEHHVDLGKIKIPPRIHDEVGYSNIDVILYVPYFEPISLPTEYYLGSEIQLNLTVDLISGIGTLNIYNSKLDSSNSGSRNSNIEGDEWVSYVRKTMIGDHIPFEIGTKRDLNISSNRLLTDYEYPYVEVKTLVPDNMVDLRSLGISRINSTYDFMRSKASYTSLRASKLEHEKIRSLLSKGVLIRR